MNKQEIIKDSTKGVVIDADNLDDIYTVFDANKIYELTRRSIIENACHWLSVNYGHFDGTIEELIFEFKKAMEE